MSEKLMSDRISQAQKAIDYRKEMVKNSPMRQRYHFMPQTGWMNDPNGLIYYRGKYHYFYQTNPYYGHWDYMHWGHAVSEDMINWEYLPLALAPSESYDDHMRGGCFSGSAIEHDGKLFLMYTGTANHGSGYVQTQCVAFSEDGINFTKYEGNPVILPPDGIQEDAFRDPKVWKHGDTYYMVCGAGGQNRGKALLYRSCDMFHWEFFSVLAESRGEWGYMWECPDFFEMDGKYVLMFSPMGDSERKVVYLVGDFDYDTGKFVWQVSGEIDWGMDYYAPQSFLAPDGRRIAVGWANEWQWMSFWKDWGPTYKDGWCGFFNLPREVKMSPDHTLQFIPIRELASLRKDAYKAEGFTVGEDEIQMQAGDGVSFEIKMKIDLEHTDAHALEIDLRCGEGRKTRCTFDLEHGEIRVDRNHADGWSHGISRSPLLLKDKKELDIHIFSDQSSVEIFTDDYRNNHANNVFAGNEQNKIWFRSLGGRTRIGGYESYGLKDCFRQTV